MSLDLLATLLAACCLAFPSVEGLVESSPPFLASSEVLEDLFAEKELVVEEEGLVVVRDLDLLCLLVLSPRLSVPCLSRDQLRLEVDDVHNPVLEREGDFERDLDLVANRHLLR